MLMQIPSSELFDASQAIDAAAEMRHNSHHEETEVHECPGWEQ